jgi:uncharacterized membrane protein YfcA
MLPGMSGYTVCEALRAIDRDIPVLILSARTLAEDRTRGFDVGANQYLTKPFDLDEFLSRIKNLLTFQSRRVRREARQSGGLGNFEFAMKLIYVLMLGLVGGAMLVESVNTLRKIRKIEPGTATPMADPQPSQFFRRLPLQMHFQKSRIQTSAIFPFLIGCAVGFLAAMLGVGGGFIMIPAMIYILGMPTVTAVGTDLFQIVLTSANVTFQQAMTNKTVDILLALCLLIGSTLGAQFGARASRFFRGEQIRALLALIVLVIMVKLLLDLVLPPENLISLATGGGGH